MKKWVCGILCLILCLSAMTGCGYPNNSTVTSRTGSALKEDTEETEEEETTASAESEDLYIVEDLDMTAETISLYAIGSAHQLRYNYNMTTKFLDKYGNSASWNSFTVGTVVTIGDMLISADALSQVQKASSVWVYDDVSKYTLDLEKDMLTIGDTNYKLTTSTKVYSDNEKILLTDLTDNDTLSIVGKDNEIYSIAVTTGHGYIQLANTDLFEDSLLFIGNKIVTTITGENTIEVPEGTYKITCANDGWGGSGEYTVKRNETTVVDLDEIKGDGPKYCDLTFIVTVPDTYVYIDGTMVDTNETTSVRYGSHSLVVTCSGYTSWDKTLVVNSSSATITLSLEEETDTSTETDTTENTTDQTGTTDTTGTTNTTTENATDDYDYETDYLSTVSDLLSTILDD